MSLLSILREKYRRFRAWQLNPFDYTNRCEHPVRCENCGTEFADNFCPRCGQKAGVGAISWHTVRQGVMQIWGMDSRSLGYSLVQLVLRPGYFISDYISGKRQVSFPPVKMLLIVAIGLMIVESLLGLTSGETELSHTGNRVYDITTDWMDANPGWGMLVLSSMILLPTWLYFRYSPQHHKHTLPEGLFVQVFMSTLLVITHILIIIIGKKWIIWLIPTYYVITYHQLFGYGWWGTLWRTCLCCFQALILIALIAVAGNYIIGEQNVPTISIIIIIVTSLLLTALWFGIEKIKSKRLRKAS